MSQQVDGAETSERLVPRYMTEEGRRPVLSSDGARLGINKGLRPAWQDADMAANYDYAIRWKRLAEPPVDPEEWARMDFLEARLSLLRALKLTAQGQA